ITTTVLGDDDDTPVASIIDGKKSEEEEEEIEDTTLLNEIKRAGFSIGFSEDRNKRCIPSGCTAIVVLVRKEKIKDEDGNEVESKNGHALRLSCDHKGSNLDEVQRITDAGVLAVTRSLGDYSMKEWVIGNPYTTRVVLNDEDKFLILACDGIWDVCTDDEAVE
ncbi:protein serine/threonine phosphatase 2C, partial [Piromyces finnis]